MRYSLHQIPKTPQDYEKEAAVAPFGCLFTEQNKTPLSLIPIYHGLGNLDDRFFGLNNGQPLPMGAPLMDLGGMKRSTSTVCNTFGLTYANTLKETVNTAFWTFGTPTKSNTNVYHIHEFKDMTHQYPNGDNYPIAATDLLWPFFSKYSKRKAKSEKRNLEGHSYPSKFMSSKR